MNIAANTPWHVWAVGIVTLLFNAMGVFSYIMTQTGNLEALGMTADQIAYFDTFPAWAHGVWALGVWGAFVGSILILLRSRFALASFAVATVGLVGTTYFELAVAEVPEELQNPSLLVAIWVFTIGSLIYCWRMRAAGVLR
ncbi:hypothetical protein [Qipengyuania sp. MTN3-11]|uniref:hypothetical protein n=1 Tax=Qipengyuania sp. MTN3-11 TaxID=3056557 RepID=UPI0036F27ECE